MHKTFYKKNATKNFAQKRTHNIFKYGKNNIKILILKMPQNFCTKENFRIKMSQNLDIAKNPQNLDIAKNPQNLDIAKSPQNFCTKKIPKDFYFFFTIS
jgi:chemotaxis receptor (MCP) glutamine deamidase CheD